jgi:hypothetical protein
MNMPITKKPLVDPTNEQVGDEILITQRGPAPKSFMDDPQMIEVAELDSQHKHKLELERFMHEELEVLITEPSEPETTGEQWLVPVTVGKLTVRIPRGVPWKVKRKYVEVLARARKAGVQARGYKDNTGEAINEFRRNSRALEYPFQVFHDPSGAKGQEWLLKILRAER